MIHKQGIDTTELVGNEEASKDKIHEDTEVLFTSEQLQGKVQTLGKQIKREYAWKRPLIICVMRWAKEFCDDLKVVIGDNCDVTTVRLSSYEGATTESSRQVKIIEDIKISAEGRDVIVVEDIVDTGHTMDFLTNQYLSKMNPSSIKICSMLDKLSRREVEVVIEYVGFEIGNLFAVGYGLDYDGKYRELPYIGILKKHVYNK